MSRRIITELVSHAAQGTSAKQTAVPMDAEKRERETVHDESERQYFKNTFLVLVRASLLTCSEKQFSTSSAR